MHNLKINIKFRCKCTEITLHKQEMCLVLSVH